MVRTRKTAPANPPMPELATILADIQRQLQEQRQEIAQLRAERNQAPPVQAVPPPAQPVPPVQPAPPVQPVPPVVQPEAQPYIPQEAEAPLAPNEVQVQPQHVREEQLYERFRKMKAPEFEGPTDPVAADNWLLDIQVILDFMNLTEQEKVLCASFALKKNARHWWRTVQLKRDIMVMTWADFVEEFKIMYYNKEVLATQQDEFLNFTQGNLSVMDCNAPPSAVRYY